MSIVNLIQNLLTYSDSLLGKEYTCVSHSAPDANGVLTTDLFGPGVYKVNHAPIRKLSKQNKFEKHIPGNNAEDEELLFPVGRCTIMLKRLFITTAK